MINLDDYLISFVINNDIFKDINPNLITLISFILNIVIFINLKNINNKNFIRLLLILRWLTDSLDGNIARKYKKVSKFGKDFDKFTDTIFILIFINYFTKNIYLLLLYIIIVLLPTNNSNISTIICKNTIIIYALLIYFV